ncbi:hypothetical protein [Anatilimnocola floriformis]|uniref:hypothetical protein n=1 Tax=Anatilimnocola floriformis TaxID=2948575 RepID=UPI0020C1C557|nr:hypothetical protein [Anatilimnocola floriformis]
MELILDPFASDLILDPLADDLILIIGEALPHVGGSFKCDAHWQFVPGAVATELFTLTTLAFSFVPGTRATYLFASSDAADSFVPGPPCRSST